MKQNKKGALHISIFLSALFFILPDASAAEISGHTLPDNLTRFEQQFSLRGCGVREFLFSDIYLLGLYLPDSEKVTALQGSGDFSRIYRLKVLYKGSLPEDLPAIWREPLGEQLSSEYLDILQDLYDQVSQGDTVEFAYTADTAEVIRINDEVLIRESDVELISALTELWFGEEPVSNNLKRLLLGGSCH